MIGDALIKMYSALKNKKYDFSSGSNPFSYFTTIAFHAFINRIKKEQKHHETITNYKSQVYESMMTDPETSGYVYVKPENDDGDENSYYEND
jgi:DNA-directed RNA polymerase specialized sigma24 family protein